MHTAFAPECMCTAESHYSNFMRPAQFLKVLKFSQNCLIIAFYTVCVKQTSVFQSAITETWLVKEIEQNFVFDLNLNVTLSLSAGYSRNINNIDLNSVRLCFQVFLPDSNKKFTRIVQPIVSQCIIDKSKSQFGYITNITCMFMCVLVCLAC